MALLPLAIFSPGKCDPRGPSFCEDADELPGLRIPVTYDPPLLLRSFIVLNLCRDKMLCKSPLKAPCRQKRGMLQVCEHVRHLFDLYGHPRAFIWTKKWKPSFHCKQMVLLTRKGKTSSSHSPVLETWRFCFKIKQTELSNTPSPPYLIGSRSKHTHTPSRAYQTWSPFLTSPLLPRPLPMPNSTFLWCRYYKYKMNKLNPKSQGGFSLHDHNISICPSFGDFYEASKNVQNSSLAQTKSRWSVWFRCWILRQLRNFWLEENITLKCFDVKDFHVFPRFTYFLSGQKKICGNSYVSFNMRNLKLIVISLSLTPRKK